MSAGGLYELGGPNDQAGASSDELRMRRLRRMGYGMMMQGANGGPMKSPWEGVGRLAQTLAGVYAMNPNMFSSTPAAVTPIAPSAAMSAYSAAPPSFTMPGMIPGGGGGG